jgi:N-acetylmuramoyl-L-alanine amidase
MKKVAIFFGCLLISGTLIFPALSFALSTAPLTAPDTTITVTYMVNGEVNKFTRALAKPPANEQEKVITTLQEFIKGPSATELSKGLKSAVPAQTSITKIEIGKNNNIFLHLRTPKVQLNQLDVINIDDFYDSLGKTLYGVATSYSVTVVVLDETTGKYKPLSDFLPPLPPLQKKPENQNIQEPGQPQAAVKTPPIVEAPGQPASYGQGQPTGALTGKTVFISAGHGWYYDSGSGVNSYWYTQRDSSYNIVEDMVNVDAVNNYLLQYLWNAGANVWTCRARSRDTVAFIVDNGGAGYSDSGAWSDSTSSSGYYGSNYRVIAAATSPTATATWRPTISTSGYYPVYVWYNGGNGSNRATDVRYTIVHSGGTTDMVINQTRDGLTWKWLGTYYFEAGSSGFIGVTNQSATPSGKYIVADAARFGDGFGSITRGSVTSGQQRQDECSRYWAEFMGAGTSVYDTAGTDNNDDVTCRPLYALWENEQTWEDPVFISWHNNASGGTGTEAYIWSTTYGWGQPTPVDDYPAYPGSYSLMTCVYNEIINDVRRGYNSGWTSRGIYRNNYGELRPLSQNSTVEGMPSALFEIAFFDNTSDVAAMKDPNFWQIVARAVYQGIVKYFAKRDALPINLLPEPPTNLRVVNSGSGSVQLTWCAPTTDSVNLYGGLATSYRVYRSTNGYGFDNGILSGSTTITISSLTPDQVYFFRVSAMNAGGESFPTNTLAVRLKSSGTANVLIVDGFDRIDNTMEPLIRCKSVYLGSDQGFPNRIVPNLINSYNYSIQHANAIANATTIGNGKFYFDSASNEAVASGLINLSNYKIVVWITGKESTADETFNSAEQTRVTTFLSSGGRLFVSGSEIGWDLGRTSGSADSTFYSNSLKAKYAGDDSNTDTVTVSASGIFNGLSNFAFDTGRGVTYAVDYPDQLNTLSDSSVCLVYSGGSGGNAAVQYWSSTTKVVNFGFPFETILDNSARNNVMQRILGFLLPPRLRASPATLSFSAQQGGSNPTPQSLTLYNDGEGIMSFAASTNQSWLSVAPTSSVVTAGISRTIQVNINITGLSYGTYTGTIMIIGTDAENSPQYCTVILTVNPQPNLRINSTLLTFSAPLGGANPVSQPLTIYNDGSGTMNWSASTNKTWLSISPPSGSVVGTGLQTAQVSVNISGLAIGTTYAIITVNAPGALNTPRTCNVTLVITAQPTALDYDWRYYDSTVQPDINHRKK